MGQISFDRQVVVVTGAGRGLGRSYALELARRGASVVVNDLGGAPSGGGEDTSPADQVVAEIVAAGGVAVANYDSVATLEGGQAVIDTALDRFGRVDAVVNNAGILRDASARKLAPEDVDAVLNVHLRGAFNIALPAFRVMVEQGYGRLVFTASAAGLFGNFGQANYAAAKMGVVGLSNVLAIEGQSKGVLSNVIAPVAGTRLTEEFLGELAEVMAPEQVVPAVVFLASSSNGLTHEIISTGGGRVARAFVGVTPGWWPRDGEDLTAEAVQENLAAIMSTNDYIIPDQAMDELQLFFRAQGSLKTS